MDDPLSLLMQGIWLLAAGMYPLGFLFGSCSACCGCACGSRVPDFDFATANAATKRSEDNADWCCSGSPPQEITVRLSGAVSQASGIGLAGDKVTPLCDQVEGDYVLTFGKSETQCFYRYEPSCEFECPERAYDEEEDVFLDPARPLFLPGIAVIAYPSLPADDGSIARTRQAFATQFVEGPGYEFGVTIYGKLLVGTAPGVQNEEHCGVYWGVPGEVEDLSGNGTGFSGASNGPEPILLSASFGAAQAFEQSACDIRGLFSSTTTVSNPGFGFESTTLNNSHVDADTIESLDACGSVVSKRYLFGNKTFSIDTDNAFLPDSQIRCTWDVEILAP
jgi:hypothetical protein